MARLDPADLGRSVVSVLGRAAIRPADVAAAWARFGAAMATLGPAAAAWWLGWRTAPPVTADRRDRRFADASWEDNPFYVALRQGYLATTQLGEDLLAAGSGDPITDQKARLAVGFAADALAPTNFPATNPAAVKRAIDTGGASVLAGARNFLDDLAHNGGRPRQVDAASFELGRNLAATPGKVVFRNDLMELIQYAPQTKRVRAIPLLASPPWINKYYVMDLAPGRSFIEWAVARQRTVFAISYRNPDASMAGVNLDDYLIRGPRIALDVICDITGSATVDIAGLCLGGALTAMLAAYLAAAGDDRIGSVTLLNTLLDYSEPAVLGAFCDEQTIARLEREMARTGLMDGSTMALTFDVLRGERPDLQLRGVELADGAESARVRHPCLERGQYPAARSHAFVLSSVAVWVQSARPRRPGTRRHDAVACRRQERHLPGRRRQRSHRAVAVVVQGDGPARRSRPVRAVQRRAHRRHRQPAGTEVLVRGGHALPGEPGTVAGDGAAAQRIVVGGLGRLGGSAGRAPRASARHGQRRLSRARRRARRLCPRLNGPHPSLA
jgi:poly(hydroxyalkanoate) polymerase-like protein